MALEYRLQIKSKLNLLNFVGKFLKENKISFSVENSNNCINLYLCDILGFMISILFSETVYFEYLIDKNEIVEEEWEYSSDLHFRLDKFCDNLKARMNMIDICIYILNNTNEDVKLLFNRDILVLERNHSVITINKNFGFWNSDELLNKIESLM